MGAVSTEYAEPHEYSAEDRLAYAGRQVYAIGRTALDKSMEISNSTAEAEMKDRALSLARAVMDSMHNSYQLFEEVVKMQTAPAPVYKDNLLQFPNRPKEDVQPKFPEYPAIEAARHDAKAFETLMAEYAPMINRIASNYFLPTGGDYNDLRQEAMVGFFKAVRDYDGVQANFESFAALCIKRQVVTAVKTATRLKHRSINESVSFEHMPPGQEDPGMTLANVIGSKEPSVPRQALSNLALPGLVDFINTRLSPFEGDVFRMFVNGDSYELISAELGVTPKNVDNAIQRFKRKIQAYLDNPEWFADGGHDVGESEPEPLGAVVNKPKPVPSKAEKPKAKLPHLGLEVDGQALADSHMAFVGPNEQFILEYLSLSQKDIFTRKDVINVGFYPQGKTDSAKNQAFHHAVANLCEKLRKEDNVPVIEAQGIKGGRKYVLNAIITMKAEPLFVTSLPEVGEEVSKKEKAGRPPKVRIKAKPKAKRAKAAKAKPAKAPKKVYESTMTSAEFWKSPIPKEKPRMAFRGTATGPKEKRTVPEPVGTAVEMVDGKEYKVTILPGFTGRAAPLPEKTVRIGSHQLTSDGHIVNLRKAAEY
jgi:RNA polymerase sporulation-specific sigma factor